MDRADRALSTIRLEALIRRQHEELFELLALCRQALPDDDATRLLPRVEFLEGLVRLDTDRALQALRAARDNAPAQDEAHRPPHQSVSAD